MKYKIILLAIILISTSGCLGLTEDAPREEPELEYNSESNRIIVNQTGNVDELILEENGERIDYLPDIEKGNSLTLGLASKGSQLTLSSVYKNDKRTIETWQHPFGSIPSLEDITFKSEVNPELNEFANLSLHGFSEVPENLEVRLVSNGETIDKIQNPKNEELDISNIEVGSSYQIVYVLKSEIFEDRKKILLEKTKSDYSKPKDPSELTNEEKINRLEDEIEALEASIQELNDVVNNLEEGIEETNDQEKIQEMQSEIERIKERKREIQERKREIQERVKILENR